MQIIISKTWKVDGELADVAHMTLEDPDGDFGVRRLDTLEIVQVAGTELDRISLGTYELEFEEPSASVQLVYEVHVKVVTTAGASYYFQTFLVGGTNLSAEIPTVGSEPVYCENMDLVQRFGAELLNQYANMTGSDTLAQLDGRKLWARYQASRDVDDALRGGQYDVPLAGPPYNTTIVDIAAYLSLIRLYELKGTLDWSVETGKPQHRYHFQREMANRRLKMIRSGTLVNCTAVQDVTRRA
jgi:phage gp36-like protein